MDQVRDWASGFPIGPALGSYGWEVSREKVCGSGLGWL
jgi:hypothetical protein